MAFVLKNGAMVEVATVGREGMAVASPKGPGRAAATNTLVVVQGSNESCYRMSSGDFDHEMGRCHAFMELVTRYGDAFLGVVMQTTGCNAAHTVEQRLAKWLLMAEDRMEASEFSLTQEFVAMAHRGDAAAEAENSARELLRRGPPPLLRSYGGTAFARS